MDGDEGGLEWEEGGGLDTCGRAEEGLYYCLLILIKQSSDDIFRRF